MEDAPEIEVPEAAAFDGDNEGAGAGGEAGGEAESGSAQAAAEGSAQAEAAAQEEGPYAHFTSTALRDELRHLRRDVTILGRENELLTFFVAHRLGDGEDLASLQAAGGEQLVGAEGEPSARLTQAQLLDVAKGCREDVKVDAALAKERSLGALSTLQVVVTQAGLRLEGLRVLSQEFATAVVARGRNPRTGTITSEAVVKFYEDSLRKRRARTEKLTWKAGVLQRELDKLRGSAKSVSDSSSELVRYITFHQLRIENSQFTSKLAAKNRELLKLKLISGFTSDLVTQLKGELAQTNRSILELRASIKERTQQVSKVGTMQALVDKQVSTVRSELVVNEQRSQDAQGMPSILDYMSLVRTDRLLKQEVAQMARKQEVVAATTPGRSRRPGQQHASGGGGRSASAGSAFGAGGGMEREGEDSFRPLRAASGSGAAAASAVAAAAAAAAASNPAFLASAALNATGLGKGPGSSCTLPSLAGTRPMGTVASVNRVLYASVGTGSVAPAPSALRRTMPAKTAVETAEAMGGRALGGGGLVAPLFRSVTGGGPLPRGVAGFSGGLASSLGKIGGAAGEAPVLSKLHLGKAGLRGNVARGAGMVRGGEGAGSE